VDRTAYEIATLVEALTRGTEEVFIDWSVDGTPQPDGSHLTYEGAMDEREVRVFAFGPDLSNPVAVAIDIFDEDTVRFTSDPKQLPGHLDTTLLPGYRRLADTILANTILANTRAQSRPRPVRSDHELQSRLDELIAQTTGQ
jgi:hypothetical protein